MKTLFGGILLAVGIIIMGLTGLCSVMVLGSSRPSEWLSGIPVVLAFAALPAAIGIGLIFAGRRLIRKDREGR